MTLHNEDVEHELEGDVWVCRTKPYSLLWFHNITPIPRNSQLLYLSDMLLPNWETQSYGKVCGFKSPLEAYDKSTNGIIFYSHTTASSQQRSLPHTVTSLDALVTNIQQPKSHWYVLAFISKHAQESRTVKIMNSELIFIQIIAINNLVLFMPLCKSHMLFIYLELYL